jgi:hypothetical protein
MGWRFRRSFKVIPGVRLNLSKSGLSASIGSGPFHLNVGPHGAMGTASIPGSGISYRQHFGAGRSPSARKHSFPSPTIFPEPPPSSSLNEAAIDVIQSASTEGLTSENLKEFKQLVQTVYEEYEDISRQLNHACNLKQQATRRFQSWERGFLFKAIFKKKFEQRKENLNVSTAEVSELEEQLRLTPIATHIEVDKEVADLYFTMRAEFAKLCECATIWDVKAIRATDRLHERTAVTTRITRQPVGFAIGDCDLIKWEEHVPHIQNSKGGDLYLYPGFILYRTTNEAFSVIDYHDVTVEVEVIKFDEEGGVPADSQVVGQTWAKANKDGRRDMRFADNHEIPIVLYGQLTFRSDSGLREEFEFSKPLLMTQFMLSYTSFLLSFTK